MNRRNFFKAFAVGVIACGVAPKSLVENKQEIVSAPSIVKSEKSAKTKTEPIVQPDLPDIADEESIDLSEAEVEVSSKENKSPEPALSEDNKPAAGHTDDDLKDYLYKMHNYNSPHKDDIYIAPGKIPILNSSAKRLMRLQKTVGHAYFHLISLDEAFKVSRSYPDVGRFTKEETDFLEMIFYEDATKYGFFGEKPIKKLTADIPEEKVVRVKSAGNYLYKGAPVEVYDKIKRILGDQAVLTSGVRSVMKQFLLFLNKALLNQGDLSLASRSLAPPGYSFHGVGDFDIGQTGFGEKNFTESFVTTNVFKRLQDLGYITLRYAQNNMLGVRFEPWHIKVEHARV
ncbi:MAG: M15 family metallopeptidase [Pseudomonadota bacterium]